MISGAEIKQLRKKNNLTQAALAEMVGVSRAAVYDWERGAYSPDGKNAEKLARALGIPVSLLFDEDVQKTNLTPLKILREETEMSLEEASTYLGIGQEELREIEEGRKSIAPTEKKRLMRAYSHYLAEGNGQGQDLIPIQGGGVCGEEGGELSEAMKVLAKDSLIRKSVRMMEDLTEEEKYKVFQYIQDQELVARVKGKKEA